MAATRRPFVDPFAEDIVNDPRLVEYSVPGLNEKAADAVNEKVELLCREPRPRTASRSPKALLVLSPRAGFGKSHLIGTVFRSLAGRATLVNIRPFEDADTRWKSILMRLVQELGFPERFSDSGVTATSSTQLELFAHGVLSQVVADQLETDKGNKSTIGSLRKAGDQPDKLPRHKKWRNFLDARFVEPKWVGMMARQMDLSGMALHASGTTWLRVLYGYAACKNDWDKRQTCIDWLQGEPVDEQTAGNLGIRPADRVMADITPARQNDLAKARVLDLFRLAGYFRPFLMCFDQTETYGKSPELARALGTVITDLTDEGSNQLTLVTANIDPWEVRLRANWEQASLDRLADPPFILQHITMEQGRRLASHRLKLLGGGGEAVEVFWDNREWLKELFTDATEMSVRRFLHACSRRWTEGSAEKPTPKPVTLEALFQRYLDEISAKPRRLVYDRDAFYWMANELAVSIDGVKVDKERGPNGEALPRWHHGNHQFVFGFESGNHWKRWHKIANTALAGDKTKKRILVYPRTPELPSIPKSTWKVAKSDIEQARRSCLLILELDRHAMVRLYAAQDFYADALQGDIDRSPEEVATFLREALADFWRLILDWPRGVVGERPKVETDESSIQPTPDHELKNKVLDIIRRQLFLSLEELLQRLPGQPDRETVLGICGEAPRVRIHTSPQMTVLQWQSG